MSAGEKKIAMEGRGTGVADEAARYLAMLVIVFALLGAVLSVWLDRRTIDSELHIFRHSQPEDSGLFEQRYLQFSGEPGVLLFGYVSKPIRGYKSVTDDNRWGASLKPYTPLPEMVRNRAERNGETGGHVLYAGFRVETYRRPDANWRATYVFVSCRWLAMYLLAVAVGIPALQFWMHTRRRRKVAAAA